MLIVANWKAYVEDLKKAKKLFSISKKLARMTGVDIVLAPPAPFLGMLAHTNKSKTAFAAQDVSATTGGAKTGEATAAAYAAAGAAYAIIGHSERRGRATREKLSLRSSRTLSRRGSLLSSASARRSATGEAVISALSARRS